MPYVILHLTQALTCLTFRDRVKLLSVQHFWLSEEPEVAGSIGWDAVGSLGCYTSSLHVSYSR
jgi:hypothetical protein